MKSLLKFRLKPSKNSLQQNTQTLRTGTQKETVCKRMKHTKTRKEKANTVKALQNSIARANLEQVVC